MYRFLATAVFVLCVATMAMGGYSEDSPEQRTMPPVVVVTPTPPAPDSYGWVTPVAVAAVGTMGLLGAAWISRKRN